MTKTVVSIALTWALWTATAAMTKAQSYYEMTQGIIGYGQAQEAQIWNAYNASLQQEQQLYIAAMHSPEVQAAYQKYLSAGYQVSLYDFAVYYVRSAGGNPQAFQRYMSRNGQLNSQDRNAVMGTHQYLSALNQQMMDERSASMGRYMYQTGESLNGYSTYNDGNYNYHVPTTLKFGQYSTDQYGNTFTVDHHNNYYRWTDWGWQAIQYGGR